VNFLLKKHISKQGHKLEQVFNLDIMQVTLVTVPIYGFANGQSQLSGFRHARENKQCYEAHTYLVF